MSAQILPFRPRKPGPSSPSSAPAPSPFAGELVQIPNGHAYPLELVLAMIHPENLLLLRRVQAFPRPFPPSPGSRGAA